MSSSSGFENDFQSSRKPVQKKKADPITPDVFNAPFIDSRKAVPKVSTQTAPTSSSSSYTPILIPIRKPQSRLPLVLFVLVVLLLLVSIASVLVYFFQFYYKNELPRDNYYNPDEHIMAMRERIRYLLATRLGEYQCNESPLFYMTETEFRSSFDPTLLSLPDFEEKFQAALASLSGIIYKGNLGYEYSGDQPVLISNLCKQFLFLEDFVYPHQTLFVIVGTMLACYLVVQGLTLLDQRSKEKKDRKSIENLKHQIKNRILAQQKDIETVHEDVLPALNRHLKEEELWAQACYELARDPACKMSNVDGRSYWKYTN